jgi:hypothetical protein
MKYSNWVKPLILGGFITFTGFYQLASASIVSYYAEDQHFSHEQASEAVDLNPVPIFRTVLTNVGYGSVQEAYDKLSKVEGSMSFNKDGQIVIFLPENKTIWTFVSQTNPAYPSVIERVMELTHGHMILFKKIQCEASKEACQNLAQAESLK